jgi:hypothetical protein
MNYQHIYSALIEKAKLRQTVNGYKERHHIIQQSMGGTDVESNIVELTAREHFVAHLLLAKIHKGPMLTALWYMVHRLDTKISGRMYDRLKAENAKRISALMTGKVKSKEHLDNIRVALQTSEKAKLQRTANHDAMRGKSNSHKGKTQSDEWITKRVEKLKGQKRDETAKQNMSAWVRTQEMKDRMSAAKKGKKLPEETKQKMREAHAKRKALKQQGDNHGI